MEISSSFNKNLLEITTAQVRGPPPYGEGFQSHKYYIVISKTAIDIKWSSTNHQSGHGSQTSAIHDFMHLKVSIPEFMIKMIKQLLPHSCCGQFEPLYTEHYRNVFAALAVLSEEKIFTVDSKEIDHLKTENDRLDKLLDIERKELEIVKFLLKKEQSTNVNILVDKNELDRIKTLLRTEQCANILVANKNHELNKENETLQKELDVVKSLLKTEQSANILLIDRIKSLKKEQSTNINILVANKNHELNRENDTLHKELDVVKSLLKTEQSITKSYLEENEKIKKDNNDIIEKLGIINQKFQAIKKIIYKK
jgi:hypothetical protein